MLESIGFSSREAMGAREHGLEQEIGLACSRAWAPTAEKVSTLERVGL